MRYLHLFLIFNLVVCYAGICGDTVFALTAGSSATESCHGSGHEMAEAGKSAPNINNYGDNASDQSPCCLDYLNSSSTDIQASVFTVIQVLGAQELYSERIESKKLAPDRIDLRHDPPDLRISHSTFLL